MKKHSQDFGVWLYSAISGLICSVILLCSMTLQAQEQLLAPEDAFSFSVESSSTHEARLNWTIPEGYYLYQHKFEVRQGAQKLALKLPQATDLHDENYGRTQVYFHQVQLDSCT